MTNHLDNITKASEFFETISLSNVANSQAHPTLPTSAAVEKAGLRTSSGTAFDSNKNPRGLANAISVSQKVSPELQKEAELQRQYLLNLTGLCSAYVRTQANQQNNQDLLFNTDLWLKTYSNLPLTSEPTFTKETFNQNIQGVEIAVSFLQTILGFLVAPESSLIVTDFSNFLAGLGKEISVGISSGTKTFQIASIVSKVVIKESSLVPTLEGYFINFTQNESSVYSNCASAEVFSLNFNYRYAYSEFNYGALKDLKVKKQLDNLISGSQIDDIKKSKGFFSGIAKKEQKK